MILRAPGDLVASEVPVPELGNDDGWLEIEMAGICHTDYELFRGTHAAGLPIIPGHEIVGRVVDIGERASARWNVSAGDRVMVESIVRCGFCPPCIRGRYKHCRDVKVYGIYTSCAEPPHLWGAYSRYVYLAPGAVVHKIPASMTPELATLLGVAMSNGVSWGVIKGGIGVGDTVVIQCVGPIGLSAIAAAREAGAALIIATGRDFDDYRLALAPMFGADLTVDVDRQDLRSVVEEATGGELADVVLDTTGSPEAIATSVTLVRPEGTVVNAGLAGDSTATPLHLDALLMREVRPQNVFAYDYDAVQRAMKIIATEKYPFELLVTHRYPISAAAEALRMVGRETPGHQVIKTVLLPDF